MNRKGYTLVEIMIVVIIIGILAAIAVPNFLNTRATVQEEACKANLRQLESAIKMYHIDNGSWPASLNALTDYMGEVPTACPGDGGNYTYTPGTGAITCSISAHNP